MENGAGHPTLIAWRLAAGVLAYPGGKGINDYLRSHALETQEIEAASAAVLCDLNTPEDYERIRRNQRPLQ